MTLRKSSVQASLPYPTSPNSPPMPQQPNPSNHLDVDASDLPPLPSFNPGSPQFNRQSSYPATENPWDDRGAADEPLPAVLRPRNRERTLEKPQMNELRISLRAGDTDDVTPRSSLESQRSKNFWEDDEDVQDGEAAPSSASQWQQKDTQSNDSYRSPPVEAPVKRKPVAPPHYAPPPPPLQHDFASNNPFRRDASVERAQEQNQQADFNAWEDAPSSPRGKGKEALRHPANIGSSSIAEPSLLDDVDGLSYSRTAPVGQWPNYGSGEQAWSQEPRISEKKPPAFPSHPSAPSPPVPTPMSPFSSQPPLIPVNTEQQPIENPWGSEKAGLQVLRPSHTPGASHEDLARYNDDLLGRGHENGVISLGNELSALPNAVETPPASHLSIVDSEQARPPLPSRHSQAVEEFYDPPDGPPPTKTPRPATALSTAESERMQEQRNETYQIKHFNWFDHTSNKLRRSSMLTQNKNGPCPLLALVNALILGAKEDSQAALDNALRAREQVSLGLIIETLMDELLSEANEGALGTLPDMDELNGFLLRLHTGMNANPKYVVTKEQTPNLMDARNSFLHLPQSVNTDRNMGTFEATQDIKLYSSFGIPLVHGWLPPRGDPSRSAFARSAPTYEDAQALLFGEEELEYKLSRDGLTDEEQQLWKDITSIKNFLKTYPTQLSPNGLEVIRESLFPGSFAIMFRNDHFSTVYKHPETGQLLTLVTDAGFADRDEIVWESLVDVNGKGCEFFSGDFRPVGNNQMESTAATSAPTPGSRGSSNYLSQPAVEVTSPVSPQERQEQHDADFAMALQLQEEEEQRARRLSGQSGGRPGGRAGSDQQGRPSGRGAPEGIPIRLRQGQSQSQGQTQEVRPLIPPRTARTHNPGVNRPADANNGDDAPPVYEEAVKGRPYNPPVGSPHHPASDPSPGSSTAQLTGVVSAADPPPPLINAAGGPGPSQPRRPQRQASAYSETNQHLGGPGAYPIAARRQNSGFHGQGPAQRAGVGRPALTMGAGRDDRECAVM